ncbi:MAG: hypothetical protein M1833_004295 [Piccolia ochrophora]|nr:MAG: hypothetical protein M1833_004295 [Piccolia ochrophora]
MFRGSRGGGGGTRGSRGRGSTFTSPSKAPLKGLFADGVWHCNCDPRLPADHFLTKNGGKNHGRWFYTCQQPQPKRCNFFLWADDAKAREESAVLSNSRSEPQVAPQTPSRGGVRARKTPPSSPAAFQTPTKNPPRREHGDTTEESQTQDHEEFFDWPLSEDEALQLSQVADRTVATSGSMTGRSSRTISPAKLSPRTPSKTARTDSVTSPGKRRRSPSPPPATKAWPTPVTDSENPFTTPMTGPSRKNLFAPPHAGSLPSPSASPSPNRTRDFGLAAGGMSTLAQEVLEIINAEVTVDARIRGQVKDVCNKYAMRTEGIAKGRDITRVAVKSKDAKIAELNHQLASVEAEREAAFAMVRAMRAQRQASNGT